MFKITHNRAHRFSLTEILLMVAINQLEEVVRIPSPVSYGQLRLHPWWDPLRDDPRFEKLVEQAKKPVAMK